MSEKQPIGPIIGSGIVVLLLIFGAVSLVSKVFSERSRTTVLPPITEYQKIDETSSTTAKSIATTTEAQ